jgi:hypothetical protein
MLAEPGLGLEQELVDRVRAQQRRLEGVGKGALDQERNRALQDFGIARRAAAPLRGERRRAGIESRRHALRAPQQARALLRLGLRRDHRRELVAQPRAHGAGRDQLAVEAHAAALGQAGRGFQGEQPGAVVRLEHDLVTVRGFAALRRHELDQVGRADAPGAAVEVPQHRTAPVALLRLRRVAVELGAKRDRVRLREAGQGARRHGV